MVVLAAAVLLVTLYKRPYLALECAVSEKILFSHRFHPGEAFAIRFIHSVNQSPVTEFFHVYEGRIYLAAVEFQSFGAGMATDIEYGQGFTLPGGGMRFEGINRAIEDLIYIVGDTHVLLIGEQEFPLGNYSGQLVRVSHRWLDFRGL